MRRFQERIVIEFEIRKTSELWRSARQKNVRQDKCVCCVEYRTVRSSPSRFERLEKGGNK